MFFSPQGYDRIIAALRSLLTRIGFPQRQIIINSRIELPLHESFDADVVVVADDLKTILFQFEIKLANGKSDVAFERAKDGLRGLWQHHRCFAVTAVGETIQMAEICEDEQPKWIPLNDVEQVAELLGDVKEESARQVAKIEYRRRENVAKDCKSLLWWIGSISGIALVSAIAGELLGKELSWKIYYLLTLVMGIIAAAHGLVFYVKIGESEVRIVDRGRKVGDGESRECVDSAGDGDGGVKA